MYRRSLLLLIEAVILPGSILAGSGKRSVMSNATTRVLTAHVPISLAEKVDELATHLDRSRGWIVRQALIAWIDQEQARNRLPTTGAGTVDAPTRRVGRHAKR